MNVMTSLVGAVIVSASLAGCSQPAAQPTTATEKPAYVAVARGQVTVTGGLLALAPPVSGTVDTVLVRSGMRVRKGEVLAKLDTAVARTQLATAQARLAMARADVKLLAVQQHATNQLAQRETAAAKAGAGATQQADTAMAKLAQIEAKAVAAKAGTALATSAVEAARVNLVQHTLRAPGDAYVVRVWVQPGSSVSAQTPAFTLLPARPLLVQAKLNATYAGRVHPGMQARVSTQVGLAGKFIAAHVIRVGRVFVPDHLDDNPAHAAATRAVDCMLAFDGPTPFRVGQRVLVRFLPDNHPAPAPARKVDETASVSQ